MSKENHTTKEVCYPENLIDAIIDSTNLETPEVFTKENHAGLLYALYTLEDREREVLWHHYKERRTISEIAQAFSISPGRVRQIESKALVRLRYPYRWNFIKLGIDGVVKNRAQSEYNRGYTEGHRAGYADGFEDGRRGVVRELGPDNILNMPMEELNLTMRSRNCLISKNCKTVGDVARLSEDQIRVIRNFGKKSAAEVAQKLAEAGVKNSDWDLYLKHDLL